MTLTAPVHRPKADAGTTATGPETGTEPVATSETSATRPDSRSARTRDADGLAVASFVLGLVGLLVMNILLGPAAIVMAAIALARSTSRRGRAFLGLALGIADLVVLACLVTGNGVAAWNFGG
ncbi:DUF4190 domain-containing protein [Streptomyces sp. JV185]|uniref:DUF4190 domain-containing protein n=1 Tax=Streptomyces sp. JV185 TaxID=858638 RepID=UPI002E786C15|nr:DUF4190 domain-containing protein [Streptomyces sp. JV185]MEE1767395.1 DUF4190 domain-containing protein [Streptomyces sp. JV185]